MSPAVKLPAANPAAVEPNGELLAREAMALFMGKGKFEGVAADRLTFEGKNYHQMFKACDKGQTE